MAMKPVLNLFPSVSNFLTNSPLQNPQQISILFLEFLI